VPHHSGPAPYHNTCVEVYFRRYIDGRMYAAIWPYYKVTRTEALDKQGNVVRLATPEVTKEQRLFIVRDDGVMFGDDGSKSFAVLGLDIHLSEIPPQDRLWTAPSAKAYAAGTRPNPPELFRQVVSVVDRFIDFDRSLGSQQTMCELAVCYILATWFLDAFTVATSGRTANGGAGRHNYSLSLPNWPILAT